jgi:hypothetical protein
LGAAAEKLEKQVSFREIPCWKKWEKEFDKE